MNGVGAGFDGGVQHGTGGAAQFGAEVRCLHLELGDRIHRWQDNEVGSVEKVSGVGIVVDTVQQVVILRGLETIGRKGSRCGIAARIRL